jgi:hypothetical protein
MFELSHPGRSTATSLELGRDGVERGREVLTDGGHHTYGGDGDQRGDQAILDGGRALIVTSIFSSLIIRGVLTLCLQRQGSCP